MHSKGSGLLEPFFCGPTFQDKLYFGTIVVLSKVKNTMKNIFMLAFVISLMSCGTSKNADSKMETSVEQEEVFEETMEYEGRPRSEEEVLIEMEATVRMNKDGCPLILEVIDGDLFYTAYPVNLAPQFKVDGMRISLGIRPSKAPLPEGCSAQKTVSVHEVQKL